MDDRNGALLTRFEDDEGYCEVRHRLQRHLTKGMEGYKDPLITYVRNLLRPSLHSYRTPAIARRSERLSACSRTACDLYCEEGHTIGWMRCYSAVCECPTVLTHELGST